MTRHCRKKCWTEFVRQRSEQLNQFHKKKTSGTEPTE